MTDGELTPSKAEKKKLLFTFNRVGTALIAQYLLMTVIGEFCFWALTPFIKTEFDADGFRIVGFAEAAVRYSVSAVASLIVYFLYYRLYKNKAASKISSDVIDADDLIITMGLCMLTHRITMFVIRMVSVGLTAVGYTTPELYYTLAQNIPTMAVDILTSVVLAPIAEELIFRGLILSEVSRINERFAVVFSAVLFGLLHGNPVQLVSASIMGLVLGYSVIKTKSIVPAIAGHSAVNFMNAAPDIAGFIFDTVIYDVTYLAVIIVEFIVGIAILAMAIRKRWINRLPYTAYHKKRTLPVMVRSIPVIIILVVYVLDIIKSVEPVEKTEEFTETAARIFLN